MSPRKATLTGEQRDRLKGLPSPVDPTAPLEEAAQSALRAAARTAARKDILGRSASAPAGAPAIRRVDRVALEREVALLDKAWRDHMRAEADRDYWFFFTEVLFPKVWQKHYTREFHKPIADALMNTQKGENWMFLLFRQARKSYLIDIGRHIYDIVRDPNIRLMLVGAREETVLPFARLIRSAFIKGTPGFETFQTVYPEFVIRDRQFLLQASQFTHPLRTRTLADPTFRATYLGVTGAGWRCMTPESLVITSQGIRPISSVSVGDRVLAHTSRYRRVDAKIERQISEPVYAIRGLGQLSCTRVTGDHRLLAFKDNRLDWFPAAQLSRGDLLAIPCRKTANCREIATDQELQEWFDSVATSEDFWRLLGYYMAEGWVDDKDDRCKRTLGKQNSRMGVVFDVRETEYIEDVKRIVSSLLGVKPSVYVRNNTATIRWSHLNLKKIVSTFGHKAHLKRIPYWIENAAHESQLQFLRGYWRGDGHCCNSVAGFVSASIDLAVGVQRMLYRLGVSASVNLLRHDKEGVVFPNGRICNIRRAYAVTLTDPYGMRLLTDEWQADNYLCRKSRGYFLTDYYLTPIDSIEREDYEGVVIDLTVREDASFCSPGLISHNCDKVTLDDCVERRNVSSPEMAQSTLRKLMDFFPLVDTTGDYGNIYVCGTRFAYYDPYGAMIGDRQDVETDDSVRDGIRSMAFRTMVRHVIEDPDRPCEVCPRHVTAAYPHGHPTLREGGVPTLYPVLTREMIEEQLRRYSIDPSMGESEFWHQYMNVCLSPALQKLQREWFERVVQYQTWPSCRRRIICLDDASKDFQKKGIGDYSVALFGEFDDEGRLLLTYGLRDEHRAWTREEFLRRILAHCQAARWWPHTVVKEKAATDNFLADVQRKFNEVQQPVSVTVVPRGRQGKNDWIVGAIQGPLERGEVLFSTGFPSTLRERVQMEGSSLGQVAHEDAIDALSLFFAEGVRFAAPLRISQRAEEWAVPDLNLYDPERAPAAAAAEPARGHTTFSYLQPDREVDFW